MRPLGLVLFSLALPTLAVAGSVKVDRSHSGVMFQAHHFGAGYTWGRFNDFSGQVDCSPDGSTLTSLDITVQASSIDSGIEKRDKHLRSPDFLNVDAHPTITFKSTKAEKAGDKTWKVSGDLSLHGVTRPVEAMVEVTGVIGNPVQKKAGFEAVFEIKRSDFGMDWGVKNKALGDNVKMVVGLEGDWKR